MSRILVLILAQVLSMGYVFFFKKRDYTFNLIIKVIFTVAVAHCIFILLDLGTPAGLLYGPLLYFSYRKISNYELSQKQVILHSLPFLAFNIVYSVLLAGFLANASWVSRAFIYYPAYFAGMVLSLGCYAIIVFSGRRQPFTDKVWNKEKLVSQLSLVDLIIAILILMMLINMLNETAIDFGFNPQLLVYALLLAAILLIARYLFFTGSREVPIAASASKKDLKEIYLKKNFADGEKMEGYASVLFRHLEETRQYLDADLTFETLAAAVKIPKHDLSILLHVYIGKGFYQLLAEYRIKHAVSLLKDLGGNLTIESLAYDCGFNSKTSFNRYFKKITGYTPSVYRFNFMSGK